MNDAKLSNTEQQGCGDMMGDGLARHGLGIALWEWGMGNGHEDGDGGGMEWAELGDLLLGRRLVWSGLLWELELELELRVR